MGKEQRTHTRTVYVCKTTVLLTCYGSSASDHSLGMGFLWLCVDVYVDLEVNGLCSCQGAILILS